MYKLFFLIAFFALLWLIGLAYYWLSPDPKKERAAIMDLYRARLDSPRFCDQIKGALFGICNAHVVHPLFSAAMACLIIVLFAIT